MFSEMKRRPLISQKSMNAFMRYEVYMLLLLSQLFSRCDGSLITRVSGIVKSDKISENPVFSRLLTLPLL